MIDAHLHVWRLGAHGCIWPTPDLAAIHRDHLLDEALAVSAAQGIERVLLVQSQEDDADTEWLLDVAAASDRVAGVVGWADLAHPAIADRLAELAARGPLRSLRIMAQDRPADVLHDPALDGGLAALADRGLTLDLLVRPHHLAAADDLAVRLPGLRMVIDHCAKPPMDARGIAEWEHAIAPLADRPNVSCKLSGLVTETAPGQPAEAVLPVVAAALALFGPERLIWGSDWPVVNLRSDHAGWLALARRAIPAAHHPAVFGGNARAFYRLDPA